MDGEILGMQRKIGTGNNGSVIGSILAAILGLHVSMTACEQRPSGDAADESTSQSLDQYVRGSGAKSYQCSGEHLSVEKRYTNGKSFGSLNVDVSPELASVLQKSLGAVPVELGRVMEAFQAQIKVTPDAKTLCKQAGQQGPGGNAAQSCWIANQSGLSLIFAADEKTLSETVVRTFSYAFSEYFVPNIEKFSNEPSVIQFANNWKESQEQLAQAVVADVKAGGMLTDEDLEKIKQNPTFAQDVTADAFDSYYCSKSSQTVMAEEFPQTWKVFTGG